MDNKPEELNQNAFDNGGDEELREDRGDFFEADESAVTDSDNSSSGKSSDKPADAAEDVAAEPGEASKAEDAESEDAKANRRAVPLDRFNEVNEQKKLLEQQNEMLRKLLEQQQGQQPGDGQQQDTPKQPAQDNPEEAKQLRELRRQLKDALYADDEDKYDEIQEQIDAINERRSRAAVRAELEAREAQVQAERVRNEFASTAQRMVEKFPVLHAETGDPEAIKKVVALRDYYINADKLSPAAALEKASTEIGELYTGRVAGADDKGAKDQRRAAAIERGVREANDQPPPTAQAGVGARAQAARLNPEKMSEREFNALPEEERARLRGDIV